MENDEINEKSSSYLLFQEVLKRLDRIDNNLVGVGNCQSFRSQFDGRLRKLEERIEPLEEICHGYIAIKSSLVSDALLMEEKQSAIKEASEEGKETKQELLNELKETRKELLARMDIADDKRDALKKEVDEIKTTTNILKLSWDVISKSPGAKIIISTIGVTCASVLLGRAINIVEMIQTLGYHDAVLILGYLLVGLVTLLITAWFFYFKRPHQKISGIFRVSIILLLLISGVCLAQEEPVEEGIVWEEGTTEEEGWEIGENDGFPETPGDPEFIPEKPHPVILPADELQKVSNIIIHTIRDPFSEQEQVEKDHWAFLNETRELNLTQILNNSSLFIA